MASTGEEQTFAGLDAAANRLSQVLYAAGLRPGDHVAICIENHPRYFEVLWGCHYAGLVYTACSSRLTSSELCYILNDCAARVFITSRYKADRAAEIVADTLSVELRLMLDGAIDGYESYEAAVAGQPAVPLAVRIAGADMLYSSGTTGRPKGVTATFEPRSLLETPVSVTGLLGLLFGGSSDSVYLSPAPLYHAAPLRFSMSVHALGGTVIVMEHFDPEEYLALIERHRANISQVVPTMFVRLVKLPAEVRARYDVNSMKCIIHAAAPCPIPVKKAIIEWFGPIVHEYYAGTEGNGFVYCNSEMWLAHEGTVGTAIACTVHICGDDGEELARYESGAVFFEGGAEFEYHNDAEKTAGSRHPKGWSTLGDVGYLDDDDFLYLTDRKAYTESKTMRTSRPFQAMASKSARMDTPPNSFVPLKFQTPNNAAKHKPAEAPASPFFMPSVIQRGIDGSANISRHAGGTSRRIPAPLGVSYLINSSSHSPLRFFFSRG